MTNTTRTNQELPFTLLNSDSQNTINPVLYYDPNASIDDIYECAVFRLQAIISLLKNIDSRKDDPEIINALVSISTPLINEALTLLEELNPHRPKTKTRNHT
ncbi:hypothetical protein DKL61_00615 [Gammaproteobacteria bacterium ESL0073]|nr:hypothetical protein DKL61_00615 [Gammaproteobacteria bacterium ESL0073]